MSAEAPPQPTLPPTPGDRRPLASRDTALARRCASWLVARGVSANGISVAGLIGGLAAGALLAMTAQWPDVARVAWFLGALLVQFRLACNLLDGMVAIESGKASPVGELFNEVPDRVADTAVLVGLGYAAGGEPWLGWAAALLAMFTAYVRAVGKAAGAGSDFRGPMAKPHRMFAVTVTALWLALVPACWQPAHLPAIALAVIASGSALTAWRRLLGIAARLRSGE